MSAFGWQKTCALTSPQTSVPYNAPVQQPLSENRNQFSESVMGCFKDRAGKGLYGALHRYGHLVRGHR